MSRYNRPAKVDKNQPEIVKIYKRFGALVLHTHTLKDCCDIIVTYRGTTFFVEIKDPDGAEFPKYFNGLSYEDKVNYIVDNHLTPGEAKFRLNAIARGGVYAIVWDRESVYRTIGVNPKFAK